VRFVGYLYILDAFYCSLCEVFSAVDMTSLSSKLRRRLGRRRPTNVQRLVTVAASFASYIFLPGRT